MVSMSPDPGLHIITNKTFSFYTITTCWSLYPILYSRASGFGFRYFFRFRLLLWFPTQQLPYVICLHHTFAPDPAGSVFTSGFSWSLVLQALTLFLRFWFCSLHLLFVSSCCFTLIFCFIFLCQLILISQYVCHLRLCVCLILPFPFLVTYIFLICMFFSLQFCHPVCLFMLVCVCVFFSLLFLCDCVCVCVSNFLLSLVSSLLCCLGLFLLPCLLPDIPLLPGPVALYPAPLISRVGTRHLEYSYRMLRMVPDSMLMVTASWICLLKALRSSHSWVCTC